MIKKDQADLDAEEMFGVDCNHTGQSFICEHCVAANLREKDDEIKKLRAQLKERE
jgi:hypothetical protein